MLTYGVVVNDVGGITKAILLSVLQKTAWRVFKRLSGDYVQHIGVIF